MELFHNLLFIYVIIVTVVVCSSFEITIFSDDAPAPPPGAVHVAPIAAPGAPPAHPTAAPVHTSAPTFPAFAPPTVATSSSDSSTGASASLSADQSESSKDHAPSSSSTVAESESGELSFWSKAAIAAVGLAALVGGAFAIKSFYDGKNQKEKQSAVEPKVVAILAELEQRGFRASVDWKDGGRFVVSLP